MKVEQAEWEQLWLPLWPLASDELRDGIYRMSRQSALGLRYIEANPHAVSNLLVVDIDHEDAAMRAMWDRKGWLPNAIVQNPRNGHAHAVWAMKEAITRTELARVKPLVYATAVTEGLRRSVDGDAGYSGLITKNPLHEAWEAQWVTDHLYSLDELHQHLDEAGFMPPKGWNKTRRKNPVGLGRNCTLFETVRWEAYRVARTIRQRNERPTREDLHDLELAITSLCHEMNATFSEALPDSEIRATIRSFYKWITTKYTGWTDSRTTSRGKDAAYHRNTGRQGGRKSGESRRAWREDLLEALK